MYLKRLFFYTVLMLWRSKRLVLVVVTIVYFVSILLVFFKSNGVHSKSIPTRKVFLPLNANPVDEDFEMNTEDPPLQTVYEYFSDGGNIQSGLKADDRNWFTLNGKKFRIFSGALHYFRIHPDHWRDRLRKYRAAGLNAIDVYVPWNLHEPEKGVFDFGDGDNDFSIFLDLPKFLRMAKEEDLLVIFRPGPYICAEWDFGGLPSWLLNTYPMHVRSSYQPYTDRVDIYFKELLARVKDLQFYTENGSKGGPIIMVQIENEYGAFGYDDQPRDKRYLKFIKSVYEQNGIESLLFTSDSPQQTADMGSLDGVLMTANFKFQSTENMEKLLELQPNRPILVSEFWPGWFDHWFEPIHNILSLNEFSEILGNIFNYKGSVNFYMFHGGTNFGFMNGANVIVAKNVQVFPYYAPDVTSYDYDAPLTEAGHYTPKYHRAAEMITSYDTLSSDLKKPEMPAIIPATAYPNVTMNEYLDFETLISNVPSSQRELSFELKSMEELSINNGNGQSYGYILYRALLTGSQLQQGSILTIRGHPRDVLQIIVNGVMLNEPILKMTDLNEVGSWAVSDALFQIDLTDVPDAPCGEEEECYLDLLVENMGRSNYGRPHEFMQKKGLWEGPVLLDGVPIDKWEIIPLEFKKKWVQSLTGWKPNDVSEQQTLGPRVVRGTLSVSDDSPKDTYFDYNFSSPEDSEWLHGAFFVNGFNIGRYHIAGPQKTLYIPGPFLKKGNNEILIVELYKGGDTVKFTDTPYYGIPAKSQQ